VGKVSEAAMINDAVMVKVGRHTPRGGTWIDGRHAVTEMKDAGFGSWKEVEWPGYYIRYAVVSDIESGGLAGFEVIKEQKHYMAKREFVWDTRVLDVDMVDLMLPDAARYDEIIREYGGIGIIIFFAEFNKDETGEFRNWHQKQGGGQTEYVRDRIARGAPSRTRKLEFMVTHSMALFLNADDMQQGQDEGWISYYAQNMRNARGELRNPKYMLHLDHSPIDKLICVRCFNADPKDFAEIFGDLQAC
jgi:hypothetical protein